MAIEVNRTIKKEHNYLLIYIIQIITIVNAIKEGWKVTQIGKSTYEFTKLSNEDVDLSDFINRISTF